MTTSLKRSKGSQSSLRIGTYSFWIKLTQVGAFNVYSNTVENDNNRGYFQLTSDNKWRMVDNDASGTHIQLRTNRLFRDVNAWYHMVVRVDTTQSTSTDRVRLYVNGVQETSFDQTDYPAQNDDLKIFQGGQTNREYINNIYGGSASSPNFILSHFHYADGQSYAPTVFGSTDATTGEWKINTSPTVTYGNQGFFMFKDDASLNDDSGNGNNWTADTGTIQKTEDSPSNVFATLNYLGTKQTLSNGNTTGQHSGSGNAYKCAASTLGMTSGKYYCECKVTVQSVYPALGVATTDASEITTLTSVYLGQTTNSYGYYADGQVYYNNAQSSSGNPSWSTDDIIGMALDLDSTQNTLKLYKNGSLIYTQNLPDNSNGWFFASAHETSRTSARTYFNFGNGYFGTTAVSSAGTNASGNGIFEYDVPTGYTALSTKGLNL